MKDIFQSLGPRERQIVETVYALREGGAREIAGALRERDAIDSIRITLGVLERKGVLHHRNEGRRHIYYPALPAEQARRSAWKSMTGTFFGGSASKALLALVDMSGDQLSDEDLNALAQLVSTKSGKGKRKKP